MTKKLKDSIVKNAKSKADSKPADYADEEGLRLHVTTSGNYWHYRYGWDGKSKGLSCRIRFGQLITELSI